mmetsp:Transcript_33363/g.92089  ORF Transcript_33363/g.92089 Transcript_33363/m.92089 type:complete len:417 (-) Transcript_33363:3538-4788(-)
MSIRHCRSSSSGTPSFAWTRRATLAARSPKETGSRNGWPKACPLCSAWKTSAIIAFSSAADSGKAPRSASESQSGSTRSPAAKKFSPRLGHNQDGRAIGSEAIESSTRVGRASPLCVGVPPPPPTVLSVTTAPLCKSLLLCTARIRPRTTSTTRIGKASVEVAALWPTGGASFALSSAFCGNSRWRLANSRISEASTGGRPVATDASKPLSLSSQVGATSPASTPETWKMQAPTSTTDEVKKCTATGRLREGPGSGTGNSAAWKTSLCCAAAMDLGNSSARVRQRAPLPSVALPPPSPRRRARAASSSRNTGGSSAMVGAPWSKSHSACPFLTASSTSKAFATQFAKVLTRQRVSAVSSLLAMSPSAMLSLRPITPGMDWPRASPKSSGAPGAPGRAWPQTPSAGTPSGHRGPSAA